MLSESYCPLSIYIRLLTPFFMSWRTITAAGKGKKKKKVIHPLFFSIEHVHHVAKDSNDRAAPKKFSPQNSEAA